jgi:hypothetical protein
MNSEKSSASRLSSICTLLNYWFPPFIYTAFIFYLSSLSGITYAPPFFFADKVFHIGEYGILGYLLARALVHYQLKKRAVFITAVSICFAYGMSDELHQFFVPHRSTSFMDVIADGIGSSIGIWIYIKQKRIL